MICGAKLKMCRERNFTQILLTLFQFAVSRSTHNWVVKATTLTEGIKKMYDYRIIPWR